MQIRTFRLLPFGGLFMCGLLPVAAQEAATLHDRLWDPAPRLELINPPVGSDQPWIDHTTLLNNRSISATDFRFSVDYNFGEPDPLQVSRALLVTPEDVVLMGMEAEEAFQRAGSLMEETRATEDGLDELDKAWRDMLGPQNLHQAAKLMSAIKKAFPDWHPEFVHSRSAEIKRRIERHKDSVRHRNRLGAKATEGIHQPFLEIGDKADPTLESSSQPKADGHAAKPSPDHFPDKKMDVPAAPEFSFPDGPLRENRANADKSPGQEKKDRKATRESAKDGGNAEREALRQRLHQTEQALQAAHRREAALRVVVRDLLNEMEAQANPGQRPRPIMPRPAHSPEHLNPDSPAAPALPAPLPPFPPAAPPR